MQINPHYKDVLTEILDYFIVKLAYFKSINLIDVIFDPGFGFGKSIQHNYTLLNNLEIFQILDKPILAGLSRKGMLWKPLNSNLMKFCRLLLL
jgi:dihydropteroate synthase